MSKYIVLLRVPVAIVYLSFLAPIALINNINPDVAKHNQRPLA
jgi:hypothetical protein